MFTRWAAQARTPSLSVEIDGRHVADRAGLVTIANVETYRGFLSLTPTASPIDGLFDVFIVPRISKLRVGARLVRLLLKAPGRWNGVLLHQGRRVAVTFNQRRRESVRALPRALPLMVPPGSLARLTERARGASAPIKQAA